MRASLSCRAGPLLPFSQALKAFEALGDTPSDLIYHKRLYALALHGEGRLAEARAIWEDVVTLGCKIHGDTHYLTTLYRMDLAGVMRQMGLREALETVVEEALKGSQGDKISQRRRRFDLADLLTDDQTAEPFSSKVVAMMEEAVEELQNGGGGNLLVAKQRLAQVLLKWGQEDDKGRANRLLEEVKQAKVSGGQDTPGGESTYVSSDDRITMASRWIQLGDYEEALKVLGHLEEWKERCGPEHAKRTHRAAELMEQAKAGLRRGQDTVQREGPG